MCDGGGGGGGGGGGQIFKGSFPKWKWQIFGEARINSKKNQNAF